MASPVAQDTPVDVQDRTIEQSTETAAPIDQDTLPTQDDGELLLAMAPPQQGQDLFGLNGNQPNQGNAPAQIPGVDAKDDPTGVKTALGPAIAALPDRAQGLVNNALDRYERELLGVENRIGQLDGDVIARNASNAIKGAEARGIQYMDAQGKPQQFDGFKIGGVNFGRAGGNALNVNQRTAIFNLAREGNLDDMKAALQANAGIADDVAAALQIDPKALQGMTAQQKQATVVEYLNRAEEYVEVLALNGVTARMDAYYTAGMNKAVDNANGRMAGSGQQLTAPAAVGGQPTIGPRP